MRRRTTLFLITLLSVLGRSFASLLLALTITSWAGMARLVRGQESNIKVTYPEDLRLAEFWLAQQEQQP